MAEASTTLDSPSGAAGPDALDSAIASMEQSLFHSSDSPTQTPTAEPTPPSSTEPQAPTEQPADTSAQEPGGTEEITDEDLDQPVEPNKPLSRAGRLRQQLSAAEERSRQWEQYARQRQDYDQTVMRQFVDLVLTDAEFDGLRGRAENGDWDAKQKLDTARQWRNMISPIADLAHRGVQVQFNQALAELRTLDGMDSASHEKLLAAQSPGDKLKLMWHFAKKLSDDAHKERIAALEQEVQTLKTTRAANGSQPANGGAPRSGAAGLAGLLGRDGLLSDDALSLTPAEIRARFGQTAA